MKKPDPDAVFAARLKENLAYHSRILSDASRMSAIRQAIERYVNDGSRVLDVGSGVGVWAILAAKLGARRVVAVELEETLIPLIHKHAQENGVADRIEIVHGNIDDVRLRGKFDVVVGELFGSYVFGEVTIRSFINLRERFLAEGGVIIPQWMRLMAVPLLRGDSDQLDGNVETSLDFLKSLSLNYGTTVNVDDRRSMRFAAEPKCLVEIDYRSVTDPRISEALTVEWELPGISRIDSILNFTQTQYAPGIVLDSMDSQTWIVEKYDFIPFPVREGTLRFSLTMDAKGASRTVSLPTHPDITPQTYSPVFAFTRAKMAQSTADYRSFRRKRKRTTG